MAQLINTLRGKILSSIYGRRVGLDIDETIVGPKALKLAVTDATSAAAATVQAYGVFVARQTGVPTTANQAAYTLSNPIPGVAVTLCYAQSSQAATAGSTGIAFIRPSTAFYIQSSDGSTGCAVLLTQGSACTLLGISTDAYMFLRHGTSGAIVTGTT